MTPRRAAIVVLCWNRWELTRRCLETLKAHTDLGHAEVIAVDNGSTDETPARLARASLGARRHERDEPRLRAREQRRDRRGAAGRGRRAPEQRRRDPPAGLARRAARGGPRGAGRGRRRLPARPPGRAPPPRGDVHAPGHALGAADRRARDGREPVRADARRRGDRLRVRVRQARGPRADRRPLRAVPVVLRGHGLLPAREGGGIPDGRLRRRHARPPRARFDLRRAEDVRVALPEEPEDVRRASGRRSSRPGTGATSRGSRS